MKNMLWRVAVGSRVDVFSGSPTIQRLVAEVNGLVSVLRKSETLVDMLGFEDFDALDLCEFVFAQARLNLELVRQRAVRCARVFCLSSVFAGGASSILFFLIRCAQLLRSRKRSECDFVRVVRVLGECMLMHDTDIKHLVCVLH